MKPLVYENLIYIINDEKVKIKIILNFITLFNLGKRTLKYLTMLDIVMIQRKIVISLMGKNATICFRTLPT